MASSQFLQPPQLTKAEVDTQRRWSAWKKRWDAYATLAKLADEDPAYQVACLTYCLDQELVQTLDTLPFEREADKKSIVKIMELLENHLVGDVNETYESFKFFTRHQEESETIMEYITAIRGLANTCNFGALKERLIKDRIVCGIRDRSLQKSLLEDPKLTLQKCIDKCRAAETASVQARTIAKETQEEQSLNIVRRERRGRMQTEVQAGTNRDPRPTAMLDKCAHCGRRHGRRLCPAFGKTCHSCGKPNHFASQCRSFRESGTSANGRQVQCVDYNNEYHRAEVTSCQPQSFDANIQEREFEWALPVATITKPQNVHVLTPAHKEKDRAYPEKVFARLKVDGRLVKFQIDTGASCNILSKSVVGRPEQIQPTNKILCLYNLPNMTLMGSYRARVVNPATQKECTAEFLVIETPDALPLLGAATSQALDIVRVQYQNILTTQVTTPQPRQECFSQQLCSKEEFLTKYRDLFDGSLGKLEGCVHLEVDPTIKPVQQAFRTVPLTVREKLDMELKRLESLDIIVRENRPRTGHQASWWCTSQMAN